MSATLDPYLHFDGEARAALTFYAEVFGGTPDIMTFGDMGTEGHPADQVMHGYLGSDGISLMASDSPEPGTLRHGNNVTLALSGDDGPRLRGWFEALADGGEVHVPLEKQMWGDEFGQCADRFGVTWLVNISSPADQG